MSANGTLVPKSFQSPVSVSVSALWDVPPIFPEPWNAACTCCPFLTSEQILLQSFEKILMSVWLISCNHSHMGQTCLVPTVWRNPRRLTNLDGGCLSVYSHTELSCMWLVHRGGCDCLSWHPCPRLCKACLYNFMRLNSSIYSNVQT